MTGSDIAPNFDQLPLLDQLKELCIRTHADLKVLQTSRHLMGMDRNHVDKALGRQEMLLERLNKIAGAGATQPNGEHAKPALAPQVHVPCETCFKRSYCKPGTNCPCNLPPGFLEGPAPSDCEKEGNRER